MKFDEMLNQPLPSFFESADEDFDDIFALKEETDGEMAETKCATCEHDDDDDMWSHDDDSCYDDEDDDDLESDLRDLSDDELDQLTQDISDSDVDELSGDVDQVDLTPEEEMEADDLMSVAATSELIKNEMNSEERAKFVESVEDIKHAIHEGFLLESDIDDLIAMTQPVTEATWYATKQRIQLGKEARMKQLWTVAVQASARAHNDSDYKKLQKIYRLKRLYRRRLEKKYNAEAKKRMRVYIMRLKKSKSKTLNDLGKKIVK